MFLGLWERQRCAKIYATWWSRLLPIEVVREKLQSAEWDLKTYVKAHSCLNYTANWPGDGIHAALHDLMITNITTCHKDFCTRLFEIFDKTSSRLFVESGTADEGESAGTMPHHPFRNAAADAAKTAAEDVGFFRGEFGIIFGRQNLDERVVVFERDRDLAHSVLGGEVSERLRDLRGVEDFEGVESFDLAIPVEAHDIFEEPVQLSASVSEAQRRKMSVIPLPNQT